MTLNLFSSSNFPFARDSSSLYLFYEVWFIASCAFPPLFPSVPLHLLLRRMSVAHPPEPAAPPDESTDAPVKCDDDV